MLDELKYLNKSNDRNIYRSVINSLREFENKYKKKVECYLYFGSNTWIEKPEYTIDIIYGNKILQLKDKTIRGLEIKVDKALKKLSKLL